MALRKRPNVTEAMVAASRRNAQKSTGPKTARGKAFSALNSMRHGRTARDFRGILARAGLRLDLFDWIFGQICGVLEPDTSSALIEAELMAREVWISFWRSQRIREGLVKRDSLSTELDRPLSPPGPLRINIENPRTGAKVVFSTKRPPGRFSRTVRVPVMWFPNIAASILDRIPVVPEATIPADAPAAIGGDLSATRMSKVQTALGGEPLTSESVLKPVA